MCVVISIIDRLWPTEVAGAEKQVWSLTQFYSVDFSKPKIDEIDVKKCVFDKPTIKVCVSCSGHCPGTSTRSAQGTVTVS